MSHPEVLILGIFEDAFSGFLRSVVPVGEMSCMSSSIPVTRASGGDDFDAFRVRSASAMLFVSRVGADHVTISCVPIAGSSLLLNDGESLLGGIGSCASYGRFRGSCC